MVEKKTKKKSPVLPQSEDATVELDTHFNQKEFEELQNLSTKLLDVAVAISSEINLFALLTRIIEEAKGLLKAQNGTLYLADRRTNELYFHVVDVEQLKEIRLPINNKSIAGYVALKGKPLNIDDVYRIPKSLPYTFNRSFDRQTGIRSRSMLTVPMLNHDGAITGCVQLINKMKDDRVSPFTARDEQILSSLASSAAVAIENAQLYKEIADLFESLVQFSASAIDERDPATAGHSRRVAMYAGALARALDCFTEEQLRELEYAAWLHDVGKIGVREHILNKENKLYPDELGKVGERFESIKLSFKLKYLEKMQDVMKNENPVKKIEKLEKELAGKLEEIEDDFAFIQSVNIPGYTTPDKIKRIEKIKKKYYVDAMGKRHTFLTANEALALKVVRGSLTNDEREIMNAHVTSTFKVLKQIPFSHRLEMVPEIASSHHERLDGSGYPKGLSEDQIPLQGKILALVDVFDALTAQDRPYKPAMAVDRALKIIKEDVDAGRLDKKVYAAFVKNKVYKLQDPGPSLK